MPVSPVSDRDIVGRRLLPFGPPARSLKSAHFAGRFRLRQHSFRVIWVVRAGLLLSRYARTYAVLASQCF
jgi:hypothetical protein